MFIYLTATAAAVLLVALSQKLSIAADDPKTKLSRAAALSGKPFVWKSLYLVSFIPLFLISALRSGTTGTDTWYTYSPDYISLKLELTGTLPAAEENYLRLHHSCFFYYKFMYNTSAVFMPGLNASNDVLIQSYKIIRRSSISYRFLERILIALNADVQWIYVITSFITLSLVFLAIYRQSRHRAMAVLLFVLTSNFFLSLNIVLQFIAISLCLVACEFAEKRKPILFITLVLLAASFHSTAIIFFPVYFLPRLKLPVRQAILSVPAVLCIVPFFAPLLRRGAALLIPKYAWYIEAGSHYKTEFEAMFLAIDTAVLLLSSFYYKKLQDKPYFKLWYYANLLGIYALCCSTFIPEAKRISFYFTAPHFMLLPLILDGEENIRRKKLLKIAVIVLFFAETIIAVGLLNKNGVLPYRTFRQESYESLEPYLSEAVAIISGTDAV